MGHQIVLFSFVGCQVPNIENPCSKKWIFFCGLTSVAMMVRLWSSLLVLCLRLAAANIPNDEAAKLVRAFSKELREFMLHGNSKNDRIGQFSMAIVKLS